MMIPEHPQPDTSPNTIFRCQPEEELKLLLDISKAITEADSFTSGVIAALRRICEHMDWVIGEAWLPNSDGTRLEWFLAEYIGSKDLEAFIAASKKFTFVPGVGLPGRAWQSKKPVWIKDVTVDSNFPRASLAADFGIRTAVAIPVLAGNEVVAVIDLFNRQVWEEKDESLVTLVSTVAVQLGTLIQRRQAEDRLRRSEASLANAQRIARLGSWDWDIVTNDLYWSNEIYRIFGLEPQKFEATYDAFLKSVHPDDREFVIRAVNEALYEEKPYSIDHRIVLPDGRERIVHEQAEVVHDADGKPVRMTGTVQDVTERRLAERELKKLSAAIEQSVNIVFITDRQGNIEYVNPVFEQVTGYPKEEVIGQNPRLLSSGEVDPREYQSLWRSITDGRTWRGALKNRRKDGVPYWCNSIISPIRNEGGEITNFLAIQEDITEKKQTEEKVRYLLSYDETTGLVNRARFMALLNEWIGYAEGNQQAVLLIMDMDNFRVVNDMYGHGAGDEMLRRVATMLQGIIPNPQLCAGENELCRGALAGRMGGDEFAVFLPFPYTMQGLELLIQRIRIELGRLRFADQAHPLSASIGAVFYPQDGATTRELFIHADAALASARESGGDRCHIYSVDDHQLEQTHSRLREKERIQNALSNNRFEPWFQPILDLKDNRVHHYEALARMYDTDGSLVMPGGFIETAEKFGLINAIDMAITKKAMARQARSRRETPMSFGMNLSGKNLGDAEFLSFLRNAIQETGADPGSLIFEITETAAVHDLDKAIRFLTDLRQLGCHFALDDFGVGFNSFLYLRELAVDYIKIDGSFIRKLHENANDRLFVKAIVEVARGLGIKTIAEFVENNEILNILRELGVDYAQGYAIGKPAPDLLGDMLQQIP